MLVNLQRWLMSFGIYLLLMKTTSYQSAFMRLQNVYFGSLTSMLMYHNC